MDSSSSKLADAVHSVEEVKIHPSENNKLPMKQIASAAKGEGNSVRGRKRKNGVRGRRSQRVESKKVTSHPNTTKTKQKNPISIQEHKEKAVTGISKIDAPSVDAAPNVTKTEQQIPISKQHSTPLLIFTCSRPHYLKRTLEAIYLYHPMNHDQKQTLNPTNNVANPIIISQDGNKAEVKAVIDEFSIMFASMNVQVIHWEHQNSSAGGRRRRPADTYRLLSLHYQWALTKSFDLPTTERVIILEEDLEISIDFFSYFDSLISIYDADPNIYTVSAYNDNGQSTHVGNASRVLRSDFFPGLGWMMNKRLWQEFEPKWPDAYWDDWMRNPGMRNPENRLDRITIRPEISRTFHFGEEGGASVNQFGASQSAIHLNTEPIKWDTINVSSILQAQRYHVSYLTQITSAKLYPRGSFMSSSIPSFTILQKETRDGGDIRVEYDSKAIYNGKNYDFEDIARALGLSDNEKAGVYRTAYHGVVELRPNGSRLG
eukprot:CAMPEP_0194449122 /NCGR_PEP_ID=MMETSP0176-20130528/129962_1 /TAXON_ID=216777 /ORGANISM="Proboscia alata, Strain PI-D3" /LENGTH=486 /DNA_ID=CAMNT_0039276195 /DNA_START=16 /DNA_END=1473 /DNA_ORIENTATION=+